MQVDKIRIINEEFSKAVNLPQIAKDLGCKIHFGEEQRIVKDEDMVIMLLAFPPTTSGLTGDSKNNRTTEEFVKGGLDKDHIIFVNVAPLYHTNTCEEFNVDQFEKLPVYDLFVERQSAVYFVLLEEATSTSLTVVAGDMVRLSTWPKLLQALDLKHTSLSTSRQSSANIISEYVKTENSCVLDDDIVDTMFNLFISPRGQQFLLMTYHPTHHMLARKPWITRLFFAEVQAIHGLLQGKTLNEITTEHVALMRQVCELIIASGHDIVAIRMQCPYILHVPINIIKTCLKNTDSADTLTFVCMVKAAERSEIEELSENFSEIWESAVKLHTVTVAKKLLHMVPTKYFVKKVFWESFYNLKTDFGYDTAILLDMHTDS